MDITTPPEEEPEDTTNKKEKEDGGAAGTAPPATDNSSRETEALKQENDTPETLEVTPVLPGVRDEQGLTETATGAEDLPEVTDGDDLKTAPNNVDEGLSVRDQILAARKKPEEVAGLLATQSEQMSVPVYKRPPDGSFWRVRTGDEWDPTLSEVLLLRRKDSGGGPEFLLVPPALEPVFNNDARLKNLVTYYYPAFVTDTRGRMGWWAVPSRSDNDWHVSARTAMRHLMSEWGMIKSDMASKGYRLEKPLDDLGEPAWPTGSYDDWFVKGLSDKVIDSEDHPVLKDLQGRQ